MQVNRRRVPGFAGDLLVVVPDDHSFEPMRIGVCVFVSIKLDVVPTVLPHEHPDARIGHKPNQRIV